MLWYSNVRNGTGTRGSLGFQADDILAVVLARNATVDVLTWLHPYKRRVGRGMPMQTDGDGGSFQDRPLIGKTDRKSSENFAASREEYIFSEEDDGHDHEGSLDDGDGDEGSSLEELNSYQDNLDYYAILGLPSDPPPSDTDIRSAFHFLSLSLHPDKHPSSENEARKHFARIEDAYQVLIDPQKRVVYDLLGAEGVLKEWSRHGAMGSHGAVNENTVGIRAMNAEEFRLWFLGKMQRREREVLDSMVNCRVCKFLDLL